MTPTATAVENKVARNIAILHLDPYALGGAANTKPQLKRIVVHIKKVVSPFDIIHYNILRSVSHILRRYCAVVVLVNVAVFYCIIFATTINLNTVAKANNVLIFKRMVFSEMQVLSKLRRAANPTNFTVGKSNVLSLVTDAVNTNVFKADVINGYVVSLMKY